MPNNNSICRPHSTSDASDQSGSRGLLARLESVLAEQLQYAAENKLDALADLTGEADSLLARLGGIDISADSSLDQAVRRVAQLHRKLIFSLATQKQEAAGKLKHLRRGKTSLRGYQNSC